MTFELPNFLPYLLNQAAEAASKDFQTFYRSKYNMLRTEWRVLFHLGCYGDMTAKGICEAASMHKTKVSRAVNALERNRFLARSADENDRRIEHLSLTKKGQRVFADLSGAADTYERDLTAALDPQEITALRDTLRKLMVSR